MQRQQMVYTEQSPFCLYPPAASMRPRGEQRYRFLMYPSKVLDASTRRDIYSFLFGFVLVFIHMLASYYTLLCTLPFSLTNIESLGRPHFTA